MKKRKALTKAQIAEAKRRLWIMGPQVRFYTQRLIDEIARLKKTIRYDNVKPGAWVTPIHRGYKMRCCDCGLVHTMDFRITPVGVQFRVFRDNRATAANRRKRKRANSGRKRRG